MKTEISNSERLQYVTFWINKMLFKGENTVDDITVQASVDLVWDFAGKCIISRLCWAGFSESSGD